MKLNADDDDRPLMPPNGRTVNKLIVLAKQLKRYLGDDDLKGRADIMLFAGMRELTEEEIVIVDEVIADMTEAERHETHHAQRHMALHKSLDELMADYLMHNKGKVPSHTTLKEFMEWSFRQTVKPDGHNRDTGHELR